MSSPDDGGDRKKPPLETIEERNATSNTPSSLEDLLLRGGDRTDGAGGGLGHRRPSSSGGRSVASAPGFLPSSSSRDGGGGGGGGAGGPVRLPRTFDGHRPFDPPAPSSGGGGGGGGVSSRSARYNPGDFEHLLPNLPNRGPFGRYTPQVDRALTFVRQNRVLIGIVACLFAFTSLTSGGAHISLITIQYSTPRAAAEHRERGLNGGGGYSLMTDDGYPPSGPAYPRSDGSVNGGGMANGMNGGLPALPSGGGGPPPRPAGPRCGVSCARSAAQRPLRANPSERHGVKCCSSVQNAGFVRRKRGRDWRAKDWCPYALVMAGEGDECSFRTHGDASDFCLMRGGRLCTARELEGECAAGVGCGFDSNHVWTSDGPASDVDDLPAMGAESLPAGGFYASADGGRRDDAPSLPAAETIPGGYDYAADTLIHVLSPYRTNTPNPFGPVDFEQYCSLVSVQRARDAYNEQPSGGSGGGTRAYERVAVVCAVLRIDMAQGLGYLLSKYCDHVVELPKSVPFVYPRHELRVVPFVQDMIDVAVSAVGKDEYHLMLTNADISVGRNFYMDVDVGLRKRNANALSINRKGVGPKYPTIPVAGGDTFHAKHEAALRSVVEAEDLIRRNRFDSHPGYDCFVFHSSFLAGVDFGDLFLGVPWWATHVNLIGHIMGENYDVVKSDGLLLGTFHFGNSMAWMPSWASKVDELRDPAEWRLQSFWKDFSGADLELLLWCPILRYPPFDPNIMQNAINCGRLFRPRTLGGDNVPSFVREGHEGRFSSRYSEYLGYTSDGFPVAVGDQFRGRLPNVGPSDRLKWLQKYNSS